MTASSSRSRHTSERPAAPGCGTASRCAGGATIPRRAFLAAASRAAAGLAGAGALAGCTVPPRTFRAPDGPEVEIPLARFPELERPGGVVRVTGGRWRTLYVLRSEGDVYTAVSGVCTHQGCTVAPAAHGFRCPCHGSTFDRTGRNTGGPAPRALPRFAAERRGDVLVVRLEPPAGAEASGG